MNYRELDTTIAAMTSEARAFVGYQRRCAEAFLGAPEDVEIMDKVEHMRVRGMWHMAH